MSSENRVAGYLESRTRFKNGLSRPEFDLKSLPPKMNMGLQVVESQIRRHPAVALACGLAAGIFLGWLIKRR